MAINKVDSPTRPWEVDYRTASGQRKRRRFKTKREAQDFLAETTQQVRSGDWVDPKLAQKMTVGQLYEKWIGRIETVGARGNKPARPKTVTNYRHVWSRHIAPRWEYVALSNVQYHDIAQWVQLLDVGDYSREITAKLLGRILSEGVRLGVLSKNPAKDRLGQADYIRRAPRKKKHLFLSREQLGTLVKAMPTDQDRALVLLGGLSGLRWGEATALRWGDIDLQKGTAAILRAYSDVGGELVLGPTKAGSERLVPLHEPTRELLKVLSEGRQPGGEVRVVQSARGFPVRNGRWHATVLRPVLAKLHSEHGSEDALLPPLELSFHDLRHTAVSLAISAGGNIKVIQRIAGHASATLTLDTYAGLFDSDLAETTERLDAFLVDAF